MRVTIAQLNPTIGDTEGNLRKLEDALVRAEGDGSDLVVLPELFLTGYPPRDLLNRKWFLERVKQALDDAVKLSARFENTGIIAGVPVVSGSGEGNGLFNSAVLIHNGEVVHVQHKSLLPTYDVFDEARYFDPAGEIATVRFKDDVLGISVCEDAWYDPELWPNRNYDIDPIEVLAEKGATLLINISASPFYIGKELIRYELISRHAKKHGLPFVIVNQVGANDELIFDGRSLFVDCDGKPVEVLPPFKEEIRTIDTGVKASGGEYVAQERIESVYDALLLGIRDYIHKCEFSSVVAGSSGGIDSAVTLALAVGALGKENVTSIAMPSEYSSDMSSNLAGELASNLGIRHETVAITPVYESYRETLSEVLDFSGGVDVTLENVQARIRGNILMAHSNKLDHILLATGNKSELSVGYCTLYGDMAGGLAPLSDVWKSMVYELAEFINREGEVIPGGIIERAPSAELRPNQKDQDSLPPYDVLDGILELYIDEGRSVKEIVAKGFDEKTVEWIVRAVHRNEYKRLQAAPGLKITSKAYGMGRRMPIAARYRD